MKLKLIVLIIALSTALLISCTDFTNPLSSEEDYYSGTGSNGYKKCILMIYKHLIQIRRIICYFQAQATAGKQLP